MLALNIWENMVGGVLYMCDYVITIIIVAVVIIFILCEAF